MKKAFAIVLLFLLFLQAIPVGHFFASEKSIFYAYVDEDKPEDGKQKNFKEQKENLSDVLYLPETAADPFHYPVAIVFSLPSPYLEFITPPPDVTC